MRSLTYVLLLHLVVSLTVVHAQTTRCTSANAFRSTSMETLTTHQNGYGLRLTTPASAVTLESVRVFTPETAADIPVTVFVWSNTSQLLASKTTTGTVANTWLTVALDTHVVIPSHTQFTVSVVSVERALYVNGLDKLATPGVSDPRVIGSYITPRDATGMPTVEFRDVYFTPRADGGVDVNYHDTFFMVDPVWTRCVIGPSQAAASNRRTALVGNVLYGPGICNVTNQCIATGGAYTGPRRTFCASPESDCAYRSNATTCTRRGIGIVYTTCTCNDPCLTGPLCAQVAPGCPHAPLCRNFGPLGCNSTSLTCVRQAYTGTRSVLGVQVPATDVCCPRGFAGDACEMPVGCTVGGCDNGGVCVVLDADKPGDSYCDRCPAGSGNSTHVVHGFRGKWCHLSNSDGVSWRRVRIGASVAGRRLLSATVAHVAGSPVYRVCECGVTWLPFIDVTNVAQTLSLMLTGNYARDTTDVLMSVIGFARDDRVHIPSYERRVGLVDEARYLCAVDFACAGFYHDPSRSVVSFYTRAVGGTTRMIVTGTAVHRYDLDRLARRPRCTDPTLDAAYYAATHADVNRLAGKSVGNLDIPLNATTQMLANAHFRVYGHMAHLRPNAECDLTVDVSQDVQGCTYVLPIEALVGNDFAYYTTRTDVTHTNTTATCVGGDVHITTTAVTTSTIVTARVDTDEVVKTDILTLHAATLVNETRVACTVGAPPTTTTHIETHTLVDAQTASLSDTCAPVSLVPAERFDGGVRPAADTGVQAYEGATPVCACSIPFEASQPNRTDCARTMCGTYGRVNATWVGTRASPEACVCVHGFITTRCSNDECDWCQRTTCGTDNGGTVDVVSGKCSCPRIFDGDHCEISLCVEEHTFPFNYSHQVDILGRTPESFMCECSGTYHGIFCEQSCINGEFTGGACVCKSRNGFRGPACDEPICGKGGEWTRTRFGNTTDHLTDTDVGVCVCSKPWMGTECREHTCDTNQLADVPGWNGIRPFGDEPVFIDDEWECACRFPYAGIATNTSERQHNCAAYNCGFGTPSGEATTATPAHKVCECDPSASDIGIRTDPDECTAQTSRDCPKPCGVAHCRVDTNKFGFSPVGGTRSEPCCNCPAVVAYDATEECTPFCAFFQPCITTNTSGFEYNRAINTWECKCTENYSSLSNITNDCSIFTPPGHSVDEPSVLPPGGASSGSSPGSDSGSGTIVDGLSDVVLFGMIGAGVIIGIAGMVSVASSAGIPTAKVGAPRPMNAVLARRTHAKERTRLLAALTVVCISLVDAVPFEYPHTLRWNKISTGSSFRRNTLSTSNQAIAFVSSSTLYGPNVNADNCVPFTRSGQVIQVRGPKWKLVGFSNEEVSVVSELVCRIPLSPDVPNASIGDTSVNINTWSRVLLAAPYTGRVFIGINMCTGVTGDNRLYCTNGECVGFPATSLGNEIQSNGIGFAAGGSGFERMSGPESIQHWDYNIRGCKCNDGYSGVTCMGLCPTGRDLCTGRGDCTGSPVTRASDLATCICSTGCQCEPGYTGDRCEIARQTVNHPEVTDWSHCCAWDSMDCKPLLATYGNRARCIPQRSHTRASGTSFMETDDCPVRFPGFTFDRFESAPLTCGEDRNGGSYIPAGSTEVTYPTWRSYVSDVDGKTYTDKRAGQGQCWSGPTIETVSRAQCWCNTDLLRAGSDTAAVPYRPPRRGWWGSRCEIRTCTRASIPTPPLNRDYDPYGGTVHHVAVKQCSGNHHPTLTDGGARPYDASNICNDKLVRDELGRALNVNTPGECTQCRDGWGAFAGLSATKIAGTVYAPYGNGLCQARTLHSGGGGVCGGYGIAVSSETIEMRTGVNEGPAYKYADRILRCECPLHTQPYGNTGICQRTCAAGLSEQVVQIYNPDGTFKNVTLAMRTSCGGMDPATGYYRGLCRPIIDGDTGADGFNSACMCNAGWNGPDCSVRDVRFFDNGYRFSNSNSTVCGQYGRAVLRPMPANNRTAFIDREYFRLNVVPLQGAQLGSITAYTAYMCECTADAPPGYTTSENTKGVCARGCSTLDNCSGHGTCITDPTASQSADKVCRCERGWGGVKCSIGTILRDGLNKTCGGTDRGTIVYTPNTHMLQQECACLPPYEVRDGMCWRNCPMGVNPYTGVSTLCTDAKYGTCAPDAITRNDHKCTCFGGFTGAACDQTTAPAARGQSGTLYPCTGHGEIDQVGGYCVCFPGYVGVACELDVLTRSCGTGQAYRDNVAAGVSIIESTLTPPTIVADVTTRTSYGYFDTLRYLMANPDVADAGVDGWVHWLSYQSENRKVWLTNGAHGVFDSAAYLRAYPDVVAAAYDPSNPNNAKQHYIQSGFRERRYAWVV